jgi:hypothetical protein
MNDSDRAIRLNFNRPIAANLLRRTKSTGDIGLLKSRWAAAHSGKLLRPTRRVEFFAGNGGPGVRLKKGS